jgi:hypothetical protein
MGTELAGEIAAAAAIGAGAVASIDILAGTIADLEIPKLPINVTQVNYTKTDETVVPLNTYLINLGSDIQATSDHVSQALDNVATLPIKATQINYSKTDESIVTVSTYLNTLTNDFQDMTDYINQQFGLYIIFITNSCGR